MASRTGAPRDRLFVYVTSVDESRRGWSVGFQINGLDLRELAKAVELPFATAEGHPHLAGSYQGLTDQVLPPSTHLLGRPVLDGLGPGTALLGCNCGDWGCWPLMADVAVDDNLVHWSHFRQPHRPDWDYTRLGPFTFNRAQYERALTTPASGPAPAQ